MSNLQPKQLKDLTKQQQNELRNMRWLQNQLQQMCKVFQNTAQQLQKVEIQQIPVTDRAYRTTQLFNFTSTIQSAFKQFSFSIKNINQTFTEFRKRYKHGLLDNQQLMIIKELPTVPSPAKINGSNSASGGQPIFNQNPDVVEIRAPKMADVMVNDIDVVFISLQKCVGQLSEKLSDVVNLLNKGL